MRYELIEEIIEENEVATSSGDVAIQPTVIGKQHRGLQCFDIECTSEFGSFFRGVKTFSRWRRHTKSEEIRQWARTNPYKDFYIHNNGKYIKVQRKKQ